MGKRGNGAGSVYRRKSDGKWVGSVTTDSGRKVFYGKTKKEVEDKVNEAVYAQRRGMLATGPNTTIQEYLDSWLEETHKPVVRLTTYINYRKLLNNYLIPGLGRINLQKLTPQQVQAFYSKKIKDGLSPKTINNIHGLLHKALDNAVRWNLIPRNICDAVTPPRIPRKEKTVLTSEQAHILLEHVKAHRLEALLTLAITTGMRRGELLGLHWQDISFEGCSLRVNRAVSYTKSHGYIETEPKTAKSRRTIMLPVFVVEVLINHRSQQDTQRREAGKAWTERDLVFTNAEGNYVNESGMLRTFKRLLAKCGLPRMRFHDLRHSAATILFSWGTHPKVVQEILGHSQISMTLDVYSHMLPSMQEDVTKRWDNDFGAPVPGLVK